MNQTGGRPLGTSGGGSLAEVEKMEMIARAVTPVGTTEASVVDLRRQAFRNFPPQDQSAEHAIGIPHLETHF